MALVSEFVHVETRPVPQSDKHEDGQSDGVRDEVLVEENRTEHHEEGEEPVDTVKDEWFKPETKGEIITIQI